MKLHPDILTDLVILYHAGEASEASRALLHEEARHNTQIAAALAATSRAMLPLPADPAPAERKVFRKVRLRYQAISFAGVWTLALLFLAFLPYMLAGKVDVAITAALMPLAILVMFFAGGIAAVYFLVRAVR